MASDLERAGMAIAGIGTGTQDLLGIGRKKRRRKKQDPLAPLRQEMQSETSSFEQRLPSLQTERAGLLRDQAQESLTTGITGIREGMNRRGLLFSGIREGAETGLEGSIKGQLRSSIAESNRGLQKQLEDKKRATAAIGLQHFGQMLQSQADNERLEMQNQLARARAFGDLAGAAGYAAGSGLLSGSTPRQPNATMNFQPSSFEMPEIGSQFAPRTGYLLAGG